jgi:hypothetical protein
MDKEALNNLLNLPKPHFDPDLTLDRISLNPYQPRGTFSEEKGATLAQIVQFTAFLIWI